MLSKKEQDRLYYLKHREERIAYSTVRDDDRVCNLRWVTSKENKQNPQTKINRSKVDYGFNRGKHLINGKYYDGE